MKRIIVALFVMVSAAVLLPATSASAGGWGAAGGNPEWDNTADGRTPIAHRCSPATTRSLSGTFVGQDGLGVNATIGFDLVDSAGRAIDLGGCAASGYGAILQLNHYVGFAGAKLGSVQRDTKGVAHGTVGSGWAIYNLPANASRAWIETYTRSYTGSPCGMTCAGNSDTRKYGWTNRREVPVSSSPRLIAPTTAAYGGTAGNITASLVNSKGALVNTVQCSATVTKNCLSAHVWSTYTPEGGVTQGWGTGNRDSAGRYRFSALASLRAGEPYKIRLDFLGANGQQVRQVEATTKVFQNYTMNLSIHI